MENLWQKEQLLTQNRALEAYRHDLESLVKERTGQLEKSEQLLENTQKMAKIGGWEWDVDKQTMTWTAATYHIHGLNPDNHEKCSSESSLQCYDPADQPVIWNAFQQCIKEKTPYDMQFCITTYQNRRVWIRTMGWPVLEDGRVIKVIGNIMDITDYKKLEEERIALTEQLQHALKADSLARMAGAIAHHYNNQLSVVMGNLELALEDTPADAVPHDNLTAALAAARKSAEISELMLTYLGQGGGETCPLDLSELCLSYLPILGTSLPTDIDLETDFMSVGPVILANANQMQVILTHLVTNAAEAIGDHTGRVRLSIRVISVSDIPKQVTAPTDWHPETGMYACLEVTDTGTGIPEQNMDISTIQDWAVKAYPDKGYREKNMAVWNQYSNKALETGLSTPSMDVEITCKDKTTRNVLISLQPGDNQHLTTFVDITERKQAEAEAARLMSAVEQAAELFVITDPDGIIQYVNPAFERVTGYSQKEVLGSTPRILKSGRQDSDDL
ncbi:MAG: PAS domain S-box protein [Desulfobacteraceae bacterium]